MYVCIYYMYVCKTWHKIIRVCITIHVCMHMHTCSVAHARKLMGIPVDQMGYNSLDELGVDQLNWS